MQKIFLVQLVYIYIIPDAVCDRFTFLGTIQKLPSLLLNLPFPVGIFLLLASYKKLINNNFMLTNIINILISFSINFLTQVNSLKLKFIKFKQLSGSSFLFILLSNMPHDIA